MKAVVEAVCRGHGSVSLGRRRSSWMDPELVTNLLQFSLSFAMSFATIGPRSRRDRATIVVLVSRRSPSDRLEKILLRQLPDYGSIAEFFHVSSRPSDETSNVWTVRSRSTRCSPITGIANNPSRPMMLRSRSKRCSHRARSQPSDARLMIA